MTRHLLLHNLTSHVGDELGVSDWLSVSQERIDQFAAATGDDQWIHLDGDRAAAESPYGGTVAHGFLTLSLVTMLLRDAIAVDDAGMIVNYGCDRVRFVSAVPAGASIRARFTLAGVDPRSDGVQVTWAVVIETKGHDKPSVVLDWKVRYYATRT
jgi:acyl dehydratase